MTNGTHTRPIHATRWANFRALLRERGISITDAAKMMGKLQGQVSHFGGRNPIRVIGDQIASEIETAFELPTGALDFPESDTGARDERVHAENFSQQIERRTSQIQEEIAPILAQAESWVRFEEKAATLSGQKPWGPQDGLQSVRRARRLIAFAQLLQAHGGVLDREEAAALINAQRKQGEQPSVESATGSEE